MRDAAGAFRFAIRMFEEISARKLAEDALRAHKTMADNLLLVARAASEVVRIANSRGGEGFVAVSAEARKKFWLDRAKTAAILLEPVQV